jgi:hypothetical protein
VAKESAKNNETKTDNVDSKKDETPYGSQKDCLDQNINIGSKELGLGVRVRSKD